MKSLYRVFTFAAFGAVLLGGISCSKDSGGIKQYYVKAQVGSTAIENVSYAIATFATIPTNGLNTCTIQSGNSGTATTNLLGVVVVDDAPITLNTYTETLVSGSPQAVITFTDANGVAYSSINNSISDVSITITNITDYDMSGYFSGTVTPATGVGDITVTNGLFVVQRVN